MTPIEENHPDLRLPISEVGEKGLIRRLVKPLFNPEDAISSVGDDCAMIAVGKGALLLASTDRVPADLIAFRLGLIGYRELGRYLATLNISDICACGGSPLGLLFNAGLPDSLLVGEFIELCNGFQELAAQFNCRVLGGDISSSAELSLSAVALGSRPADEVLTRRGAGAGDTVFVSKPIGLTPAAFAYYLQADTALRLSENEKRAFDGQFQRVEPMLSLGRRLATSGECTSCMDNTDGLGQSLAELGEASAVAIVVDEAIAEPDEVVTRVAQAVGIDSLELAMGPGADFSLVGTLRGAWSQSKADSVFGPPVRLIGYAEAGSGVYREYADSRRPLSVAGWDYFSGEM